MIKIQADIVHGIRAATEREELYEHLQNAIALEHSTIPPYLTALFSLKPDTNREIAQLIRSVVLEEMLHMTVAANTLVAIGGEPQINTPEFIPRYPGPLPMGIGGSSLIVPIERFSKTLVKNVFMEIEEPEDPIPIKVMAVEEEYATIGQFYAAVKAKIEELGDGIFDPGSADRQVRNWFADYELFPVTTAAEAAKAIDVVVEEGEGTSTSPFEAPGDPAHFYKFGEIYHGRCIVETDDGFAFGGDVIPFDEDGVYPIKSNAKLADYPVGSQARIRAERYSYSYSSLLNALHRSFNGEPGYIDTAIGVMFELKVQAVALMTTELVDGSGLTAGPSYEYVNEQGGMASLESGGAFARPHVS